MEEYLHGGDIYSQRIEMDFSANISPLGLPEGVKKAVSDRLDRFSVYPDSRCQQLREEIALHHKTEPDAVICGNGSADLIFQLAHAVRPKKALLLAPSFLEYEQALLAVGADIRYCFLKKEQGFRLEPDQWKEEMDGTVDIAFLCNPNNPTGLLVPAEEVRQMAEICKKQGAVFVVDECFQEFLREGEEASVISGIQEYDNLFILKAFTKIYGMAGFRLGYGICQNRKLLSSMEGQRQPWSVSGIAQEAGLAALKETDYVRRVKKLVEQEREFLRQGLLELGFTVYDSRANYLFFHETEKRGKEDLFERLRKKKILIRSCHNYKGLEKGYYRICVKTREENKRLLAAIREAEI